MSDAAARRAARPAAAPCTPARWSRQASRSASGVERRARRARPRRPTTSSPPRVARQADDGGVDATPGCDAERLLDLGRADVEPAGDDEFLDPVDDRDEAVGRRPSRCRRCATSRPASSTSRGLLGPAPVAVEDLRAADAAARPRSPRGTVDASGPRGRRRGSRSTGTAPRRCPAGGVGPTGLPSATGERLGHPVALDEQAAGRLLPRRRRSSAGRAIAPEMREADAVRSTRRCSRPRRRALVDRRHRRQERRRAASSPPSSTRSRSNLGNSTSRAPMLMAKVRHSVRP